MVRKRLELLGAPIRDAEVQSFQNPYSKLRLRLIRRPIKSCQWHVGRYLVEYEGRSVLKI